ncbi:PstA family ABC transporter permease [Craterilacuibacter sp.]|uniref:PstA family ABC transporter permease n=1 Tax=Craterilacuibacter sp. TaxID=2870909 RepID=UPI003F3AD114
MKTCCEYLVLALCRLAAAGFVALAMLLFGFLLWHGLPAINGALFFGDTPAWLAISAQQAVWGGIWPALVGSLMLVLVAISAALPLGLAAGIYLAQARDGRARRVLLFLVDILAGMPSIVMGLCGFMLILALRPLLPRANTSLLLSGLCVGLLVLPYLIVSTRSALLALPPALRLTAKALGLSPRQRVLHVYLPAASPGILSGVILAIGRAAEDVAVILLTGVVASAGMPGSLFDKFEALPFFIMVTAAEYRDEAELARAFASALLLLLMSGSLFMLSRRLQGKITS